MLSNFKVVFSKEAEKDLTEAIKWYNKIEKGLGAKLKQEVKEASNEIKRNPTFASIKYKNTRTVACKVFPYSIHYEIDVPNQTTRITSIFHFRRRPSWDA